MKTEVKLVQSFILVNVIQFIRVWVQQENGKHESETVIQLNDTGVTCKDL